MYHLIYYEVISQTKHIIVILTQLNSTHQLIEPMSLA
jgi:hypothetical protein